MEITEKNAAGLTESLGAGDKPSFDFAFVDEAQDYGVPRRHSAPGLGVLEGRLKKIDGWPKSRALTGDGLLQGAVLNAFQTQPADVSQ